MHACIIVLATNDVGWKLPVISVGLGLHTALFSHAATKTSKRVKSEHVFSTL